MSLKTTGTKVKSVVKKKKSSCLCVHFYFLMSTDRHIRFDEKSKKNETNFQSQSQTSRASTDEIFHRYLSCFDERLLKYINEQFRSADRETWKTSEIRIHHKDDLELRHVRRVRMFFENFHFQREKIVREDFSTIIDAFDVFLEHNFRSNFVRQCQIEEKTNEMTFNVSNVENFHRIVLFFNRLCRSSSSRFDAFELAEILTHLFPNLCDSSCKSFFPFFIVNYHRINFRRSFSSSFNDLRTISSDFNRDDFVVLDVLMKFIEKSPIDPNFYKNRRTNDDEDAKNLLVTLFYQIRQSNRCEIPVETDVEQTLRAFQIVLKKIFSLSAFKIIDEIDDRDRYVDLKIDVKFFDFALIFFEHLHRMSRRCSNDDERTALIDYFSPILFGESIETKIKEIFRDFIDNFVELLTN